MTPFSPHGSRPMPGPNLARRVLALCGAGFALALGACAHPGVDNVKPTATTAYHTTQPGPTPATPQP